LEECDALTQGKNSVQILHETRSLLLDPQHWTPDHRACDMHGRTCRAEDPRAVAWDLEGAVARISNPFGITPPIIIKALDEAVKEISGRHLNAGYFTDRSRNHNVVIQVIDTAIHMEMLKGMN
jgi:hypothetical protein